MLKYFAHSETICTFAAYKTNNKFSQIKEILYNIKTKLTSYLRQYKNTLVSCFKIVLSFRINNF